MTNSFGLVNLLNIIAFCYFDKSIMLWFTYALGKIFIGTFYTKLSPVYTNKAKWRRVVEDKVFSKPQY